MYSELLRLHVLVLLTVKESVLMKLPHILVRLLSLTPTLNLCAGTRTIPRDGQLLAASRAEVETGLSTMLVEFPTGGSNSLVKRQRWARVPRNLLEEVLHSG